MANEFDNTDPLQLTTGGGTEPLPMDTLNDPNVMFSEAARQRDEDFARIDRFSELGYGAEDIVSFMGGDQGRSHQEIARVISAKYEIEQAEIREENERRKAEFEENQRKVNERQMALENLRLKKKDTPLQLDGGLSESGLDSSGISEAVADPELAQKYLGEDFTENPFEGLDSWTTAVEGIDTPELARVVNVNGALSTDASVQFFSNEMLQNLYDGDIEGAIDMFESMEALGVEVPEELRKSTALLGFGSLPGEIRDYLTGDFRGEEKDEELAKILQGFAEAQQKKSKEDAVVHMTELKDAYAGVGIDYDLNPESDIDLNQAVLEAFNLSTSLEKEVFFNQDKEAYLKSKRANPTWAGRRLLGVQKFLEGTSMMGLTARAFVDRHLLGDEEAAQARFKLVDYRNAYLDEKSERKAVAMGLSEEVRDMGIGEAWRADDVSVGDALTKTMIFAGDLLPDVVLAFETVGAGAILKHTGKQASKQAMKSVLDGATKSAISKSLRREANRAGRKAFIAAGGRKGTALMVTGSALFGARSATGTYQSVWDDHSLTEGEKVFLSTVVGTAEGTLSYIFSGAERLGVAGVRQFISKAGGREGIKKATSEALKGLTKKEIWFDGMKQMGGEWLEEAMIETIDQGTRNMIEWANGREVKPIDWLAIEDAGIGGLLGTGPVAILGTASRSYTHSKVMNAKIELIQQLDNINDAILASEGTTKEALIAKRRNLQTRLAALNAESQTEFDKLTDSEKETVGQLSKEMEGLKAEIALAEQNGDTDTANLLKQQFEQKLELKQEIEQEASSRQPVQSVTEETDSNGDNIMSAQKDVTSEEKQQNDQRVGARPIRDDDSETTLAAEENKVFNKFKSAARSLGKHLGLTSSDPDNATKHKRTSKTQRTKAINLLASLNGGTEQAIADATAEVDAYIEAKTFIAAAEKGAFALDADALQALNIARGRVQAFEAGIPALVEATTETATESKPELEDNSKTISAGQDVDLNADWIGEGEGKISLAVANQINKLKKAFKGILDKYGINVQIHLTADSYKKATGKNANSSFGMYSHSTKTIHIQPRSNKSDVQEEFGHGVFRTIMSNNSQLRTEIHRELAKMAGIDVDVNGKIDVSKFVSGKTATGPIFVDDAAKKKYSSDPAFRALIDTELLYEGQDTSAIQEEAIMSSLTSYASDSSKWGTRTQKLIKFFNKVMNIGGYKGNFITSKESFLSLADKFKQATEGVETDVETKAEDYADPDTKADEGLESRRYEKFPSLDNKEIFFTSAIWKEGADGISRPSMIRERKMTVNDFWHFRNVYAKLTGNGTNGRRMQDIYFINDAGEKVSVKPPPPKRDRKTREVIQMDVPYMEGYQDRRRRLGVEEGVLDTELRQQRAAIMKEVGDLWRNNEKNINLYTNLSDFEPGEFDEFAGPRTQTVESIAADIEKQVIAKKNIQALIDSDITEEDLKALEGRRSVISKSQNPSIFNMSGLTQFSEAQEGDAFGEESVPDADGMESRRFEMKGSLAKILTENRGDIKEVAGLKARVFGYDRTRKGSGVRALMNKTIKWGNKDATVITAHRDVDIADIVMSDLSRMASQEIKDGNYNSETGIGYIVTMEALLKDESTLGNPDSFKRIIDKYGSTETFERALNSRNKDGNLIGASTEIRREIRIGAQKLGYNGRGLVEAVIGDNDVNLTEDQVSQIKKILKPTNALDKKSFKKRTLIAKRMLPREQRRKIYFEENDLAWSNVKTAEVVAYTKIPFKVDPSHPRGFTGFEVAPEDGAAFSGLIIEDGTIDEKPQLKIAEDLYSIPELFPGMMINIGEDVDVPMSELSAEDQMKQASTLAGISQVRGRVLNVSQGVEGANQNDMMQESLLDQESRRFESRGLMREANTDNGPFQLREKTWFQEWRGKWLRRLADKYRDVMLIQEDIERHRGLPVKESQDFKMAEERMYGKAAYDLEKLEAKTKDITSLMKEFGLDQGQVTDYLYALHAKERNALILERDGKESGSGITDAEADAIINGLDVNQKSNLDQVVKLIREIQQDTRNTMVELGLESQETIDLFESQFENYVPLGGIALDEDSTEGSAYPTGGAGLSVQGDTYKRAAGRKTQAENLLAQVIAQNASVHIQGRTNEALQSLYELIVENPNSKVWTIVDDAAYGDAHVVPVRVDGEQKYIRFADSSYAETLKGMSVPRTGALVKILRAPANWLRRSFTTLNPEFVISNFSRDIQSAIFNAMAESDIEGGALLGTNAMKDITKMVLPSLKTLVKGVAGKSGDPLIEKYFTEFQEDGGKTGWAYAKKLSDIAADIEKETTDQSTAQKILGTAKGFADTIEGVNDAFENSIRLAAYIGARENGVSRAKAAQLAKNITVNFNKHGEYGQALNAVYLFFNASIQGTMRLGRSLLTMKPAVRPDGVKREWYERINGAQKLAAGLTVFSAMLTMIARAMSGEDEDGILYYDKIPDYVKERNLIFMFDGENYIKVPMPYGFNIFANLGTAAVETAQGAKEVDEAMLFLGNSFMGAFSPISFGQSKDLFTSVGKSATPTVLKPLVEIMTNETYFGGPVYAEQSPYASPKPESSMSFRSPKAIQEFFEWINKTTGGSKHVPGNVDMNPDKFWHVFDYFLGGAGQFVTRTGETAFKVGQKLTVDNEIKVEFNDVPLMRKMYGEPSRYYDFEKFKEREDEIKQLVREYKNDKSKDVSRYKSLGTLNKKLKSINKKLKNIRARKRVARDIENYAERAVRIQELMDKERSLIMEFNRVYDKIKGL